MFGVKASSTQLGSTYKDLKQNKGSLTNWAKEQLGSTYKDLKLEKRPFSEKTIEC